MEARVVELLVVSAEKVRKAGRVVLHIDDFFLGALLEKWEEGLSRPVHAEDVDGEAFSEVVPEYIS